MAAPPGSSSSSVPSLPPPCPKSPPEYPDLYGKRREMAKVQMLEREIGFLEEELKSVHGLQPSSRYCKEVAEFVLANSDPLIPVNRKNRKSCRFWKWLCGKSCFNFSWKSFFCCCCYSGCSIRLRLPQCCCSGCGGCDLCNCCSNPCSHLCGCGGCSLPKCKCCSCLPSSCCKKNSCSRNRNCCTCRFPSCPKCSSCFPCRCRCRCSCKCSCPKCPKVRNCCCCTKTCCCNPGCLFF